MIPMSPPQVLLEGSRPGAGTIVSVAVSLYNYADAIGACLDSVVQQTHSRLELIVVDDGSTDESANVARRWLEANMARFDRVLLLRQPKNLGLSAARNLAFERSSGEYIFVLDADNALLPRAIARLLETLEHTGAAAAYSQLIYFGEATGVGIANIWDKASFQKDNYVDAMALVSKSAWNEVGGYSELDYGWEDYDFWCKFVEAGLRGVYVPELLCRYCVRTDSMLRTDTTAERGRLVHLMMAAHPWLDLRC